MENNENLKRFIDPKKRARVIQLLQAAWLAYRTNIPLNTVMLFLGILSEAFLPLQAWIGKLIVDRIVYSLESHADIEASFGQVFWYVVIEFGLLFGKELFNRFEGWLSIKQNVSYERKLEMLIHQKVLTLDLSYFEFPPFVSRFDDSYGSLLRTTWATYSKLNGLIQNILGFVFYIPLLMRFDPRVIFLVTVMPLILLIISTRIRSLMWIRRQAVWRDNWQLGEYRWIMHSREHAKEVRSFGLGSWLLRQVDKLLSKEQKDDQRLQALSSLEGIISFSLNQISYTLAYVLTIYDVLAARITLGDLTMLMQTYQTLSNKLGSITGQISDLLDESYNVFMFHAFMSLQSIRKTPVYPQTMDPQEFGSLVIRDGSFTYPESRRPALEGINLTIQRGEHIALVGENGCGKTTLIKLLMNLYEPTKGEIIYNSTPVSEFVLEEWSKLFSVIFQDWQSYEMTIADNIAISDIENYSMEKVIQVAQLAGADRFIEELENGYESKLGKRFRADERGCDLSIGQMQKLALARAFYREAPVLVLDEPFASVDVETEYQLYRYFKNKMKDKTLILISHRLSSIRFADKIYVMRRGQIIETGTHDQLVKQNGYYARLYRMQMEGIDTK